MQRRHRNSRTILRIFSVGLLACGLPPVLTAQVDGPTAVATFTAVNQAEVVGCERDKTAAEFARDIGWASEFSSDSQAEKAFDDALVVYGEALETTAEAPLCSEMTDKECLASGRASGNFPNVGGLMPLLAAAQQCVADKTDEVLANWNVLRVNGRLTAYQSGKKPKKEKP